MSNQATPSPSRALVKLRLALARQEGTLKEAGDAGEELTRRALDGADIAWLHMRQEIGGKSLALKPSGKRPDFLIGIAGTSLLLDAKCLKPFGDDLGDGLTFAIEQAEINKLDETGRIFGLPVALIVWCRTGVEHRFVVAMTDRFEISKFLGTKSMLVASFKEGEITRMGSKG